MTQATSLMTANQYIADDIGALQAEYDALATRLGENSNLTTTQKATLVGAINENKSNLTALQNQVNNLPAPGSEIDDSVTVVDHTWSSSKIVQEITERDSALKQSILGVVGADTDTLQELLAIINANGDAIGALSASFVSFVSAQNLTQGQKDQALVNIGAASSARVDALEAFKAAVGDPALDYPGVYETRRMASGGPAITRV